MPISMLDPAYGPVLEAFTDWTTNHPKVQASFISGSAAQETADRFSDLDLTIIAAEDDMDELSDQMRGLVAEIDPLVLENNFDFGGMRVLSLITEGWLRVDLSLGEMDSGVLDQPLIAVYDPTNVYDGVPDTPELPAPPKELIEGHVSEFFRVLGLSVVVNGRKDVHIGHEGFNLLRNMLIEMMLMTPPASARPSGKKLLPVLTDDQQELLRSIPAVADDEASVIAANAGVARSYLPLARNICTTVGATWPDALEDATAKYLNTDPDLAGADFGI